MYLGEAVKAPEAQGSQEMKTPAASILTGRDFVEALQPPENGKSVLQMRLWATGCVDGHMPLSS